MSSRDMSISCALQGRFARILRAARPRAAESAKFTNWTTRNMAVAGMAYHIMRESASSLTSARPLDFRDS